MFRLKQIFCQKNNDHNLSKFISVQLKFDFKLSYSQIATNCCIGSTTVSAYRKRCEAAERCWPRSADVDDSGFKRLLFPSSRVASFPHPRALPNWPYIHRELRRKGITLMLLLQEYKNSTSVVFSAVNFLKVTHLIGSYRYYPTPAGHGYLKAPPDAL